MKTRLFLLVALISSFTGCSHDPYVQRGRVGGALIGAGAGAIIGNNVNGLSSGEGALIGGLVGGVMGDAVGKSNSRYYRPYSY